MVLKVTLATLGLAAAAYGIAALIRARRVHINRTPKKSAQCQTLNSARTREVLELLSDNSTPQALTSQTEAETDIERSEMVPPPLEVIATADTGPEEPQAPAFGRNDVSETEGSLEASSTAALLDSNEDASATSTDKCASASTSSISEPETLKSSTGEHVERTTTASVEDHCHTETATFLLLHNSSTSCALDNERIKQPKNTALDELTNPKINQASEHNCVNDLSNPVQDHSRSEIEIPPTLPEILEKVATDRTAQRDKPKELPHAGAVNSERKGHSDVKSNTKDSATDVVRERSREEAKEYVVQVSELITLSEEYRMWNRVIAERLLLTGASADVYLAVTPRVLSHLRTFFNRQILTGEEAEIEFACAVSTMYRLRVLNHEGRLRSLRRLGEDSIPECIAFLALSVLAAYRMRSDEEAAGHAYYLRLAKLLGCELLGSYPAGFDPSAFESLWLFVQSWLKKKTGADLAVPRLEDTGHRRYVALPLAHVPLRCLDIERLPEFFSWAGYQSEAKVPVDRLESDLLRWHQSRSTLSGTGAAALTDKRRSAVFAQVSSELESWDGSTVESGNRRSAIVEIMLDLIQRRPNLFFLPKRPVGFPARFDEGTRVFEASDEGWYDPVPIGPEDGLLLSEGFQWQTTVNGTEVVLRRGQSHAIALTPAEYSGFVSHRSLIRGVKCAVLCEERLAQNAEEYLSDISQRTCTPVADSRLPYGWRIFSNVIPQRTLVPPQGLDSLEVDPSIEIMFSGGLRLGRRSAWLSGAPPRVFVTGADRDFRVKLDGHEVTVAEGGDLQIEGRLSQTGIHIVEAGFARQRIEIVEPTMSGDLNVANGHRLGSVTTLALPSGSWKLLGATPGEIAMAHSLRFGDTLARCIFKPIWAIQVGAGPGARVIALESLISPGAISVMPSARSTVRQIQMWSAAIYDAHVRHPRLSQVDVTVMDEAVRDTWRKYVTQAKQIKRLLKKK